MRFVRGFTFLTLLFVEGEVEEEECQRGRPVATKEAGRLSIFSPSRGTLYRVNSRGECLSCLILPGMFHPGGWSGGRGVV